ncbi:GxxExxY protein [Parabacteroides chongii]|uniref:GxxExxY protein n=1 Tax=Parabacteroides chongii TaxID=2685834 RepID=UPI00240D5270|nr:GxxExxY protein [Parabacteroides chongii]WFE82749.1 GxxExxY protein [Parabacteroides chongii]
MTQNTQTDADFLFKEETDKIIGAFYKVYRTLGYGFLERVYQNALYYELMRLGLDCKVQYPIQVYYEGHIVGEYVADMLINNHLILELKSVETLSQAHEFQLINYLKATRIEVGLLLNFGEHAQVKRKVFKNK